MEVYHCLVTVCNRNQQTLPFLTAPFMVKLIEGQLITIEVVLFLSSFTDTSSRVQEFF